jgi:hypothetical protein
LLVEARGPTAAQLEKPQAFLRALGALPETGGSFLIEKYSNFSAGISSLTSRCTCSRLITNAKTLPIGPQLVKKAILISKKDILTVCDQPPENTPRASAVFGEPRLVAPKLLYGVL